VTSTGNRAAAPAVTARSALIDHIARVDLRVRDVESALRFYRDVVGLEVADQTETSAALRAPAGPVFLHLDAAGVESLAERRATGLFHVAIRFPDRGSLGDALARLVAAHMEIGAADHGVSEALYIDDPDGNGVELYYDRPVEQWPAPSDGGLVGMVTAPLDLRALLDTGRGERAVGDPAAGGTDVGHVHLQVSDLEQTVPFYVAALGLDLTQRFGGQAGFFSSNGYHHHVGANTWNSRGGSPSRRDHAGLDRIVFAVADADQLERLRLRLGKYGHITEGEEGQAVVVRDPDDIELHFVLA
jgi:catechol 2,3-dioxygenase